MQLINVNVGENEIYLCIFTMGKFLQISIRMSETSFYSIIFFRSERDVGL